MSGAFDDARWALIEGAKEAAECMVKVVRGIRANQEYRKLNDLLHESLYGNTPMSAFGYAASRKFSPANRLSLNVCRNMVAAVTSKVAAKNKPKPTFLTEEGNYDQQVEAQNLEKFVSGVFYESKVYQCLSTCFRDGCVVGTGILKIYDAYGKVCVERVKAKELVVDDAEGADGDPPNIYHRKYYARSKVKAVWGGELTVDAAIDACPRDPDDVEAGYQTYADQILVTEGWHIGEGDEKGRHIIAIEGACLLDEEWEGPAPFSFFRWSKDTEGFFGVGLVEELQGIQAEINRLLLQIQKGHHLIAGHWMVQQGSTITNQLNNDLASIIKYTGTQPTYQVPSIIAPEVYNHLWQLYAKAFEISGVSQLNATGQKPAGLNSGEAQRVYQDIQTERFLEVGQDYEEFVIEAARQVIRCAQRIGGAYKVRAVNKNSIEYINWSDIDIDEESYVIRVYPTSLLPTTPAGKLSWAEDMIKSGVMDQDDVLDIVDFPDTDAYKKRKLAPRRIIERNIRNMLVKGEYVSPEPFDNHELALKLTNEAYHEARLDGVPDEKLALLRDYMAMTQDFMTPPPMPPAMAPPPPPPMPVDPMQPPPPMMPPMAA